MFSCSWFMLCHSVSSIIISPTIMSFICTLNTRDNLSYTVKKKKKSVKFSQMQSKLVTIFLVLRDGILVPVYLITPSHTVCFFNVKAAVRRFSSCSHSQDYQLYLSCTSTPSTRYSVDKHNV